jgi:MFS family permease
MNTPPHYRRNFTALMGDYIGFALAMTFANSTTVLPHLVVHLTDSEVVVGMLSSISSGAWLLPQLIYANLLTNKHRKKPYVTRAAIIGRPMILLYAAVLSLGLHRYPTLALASLFGVLIFFFGTDAMATVAWFDVVGKAIPDTRRGRYMGSAQLVSGLLSIGAGGLIATLLSADGLPFPHNFSVILGMAGLCLLFSLFSWLFVIEPDEPVETSRPAWRDYLPQLVNTLRHDNALSRLIAVRLLAGGTQLALGFYILFATRELGLPPETVGLFTIAQTVGRILTSVGMGALADRAGSHRVVQVATGIGLTAPLTGLVIARTGAGDGLATTAAMAWVFATIAITMGSNMLGFFNYALELAPAGQRPTYIGMFNTITGFLVVLPALGGWLLRTTSYEFLFALTAGIMILSHLLSLSLPSARHTSPHLQPKPIT